MPGEEDFGIVPVEAQACGTPVIALGRGGALETVRHGETGFLRHFYLPGGDEILLLRGHVLQALEGHVMVRGHEAVLRDERSRAPVHEAQGAEAYPLEPLRGGRQAGVAETGQGRVVEGPEPLVGQKGGGLGQSPKGERGFSEEAHRDSVPQTRGPCLFPGCPQ